MAPKGRKSTSKDDKNNASDEDAIPGVDFTDEKNIPVGHINTGDGSEEKPHNIVPQQKW